MLSCINNYYQIHCKSPTTSTHAHNNSHLFQEIKWFLFHTNKQNISIFEFFYKMKIYHYLNVSTLYTPMKIYIYLKFEKKTNEAINK